MDDEELASLFSLDLGRDVLNTPAESFVRKCWGKGSHATSLRDEVLRLMLAAFADGDTATILAQCRKPSNAHYSEEEMSELERDLEVSARTINMPYCFTPGARALVSAFLSEPACSDLGNDVEAGVYISRVGGDIAEWHCDGNHNFTIQLEGAKEWQHMPSGPRTGASRGMFDAASNRAEQLCSASVPATGTPTRRVLEPGSVLYLPPGEWHRVVPLEGRSVSVDLHIGELTRGKWLAEALYAHLQAAAAGGGSLGPAALDQSLGALSSAQVGPVDFGGDTASQALVAAVGAELPRMAAHGRPPRAFPPEDCQCDGLHRGASLEFLAARGFLCPASMLPGGAALLVSPLVAIMARPVASSGGDATLAQLEAVSSLSTMEYLRFAIRIEAQDLVPQLARLTSAGPAATVGVLLDTCSGSRRAALLTLLRVLVHANVLSPLGGGGGGGKAKRPRKGR